MHKIPTDAFDMLVTLEKRPFERAGREVVVRLLDETLPDGTKLVAASDPSYPPELAALEEHPAVLVHEGDLSLTERQLRVSIVGSRDASDSARADARRVAEYGLLISLAPQVNGLSFTDEERAESLRARNRAIAALGLGSLVMAGKEGSSTLREVAFSLELGHPVLLWHSIVEEGEPWAIRLLENPPLDSQGRPLVQTVSSAADVEEALSPWSTVWWL